MEFDLKRFRHCYPFKVRINHVDRQNVVHYAWYPFFFDEARIEYLRAIGLPIDDKIFISHTKYFVVQNTNKYYGPSTFDDDLELWTRIARVKNSSLVYEHVAVRKADAQVICTGTHATVYVNTDTNKPERVPDFFRGLIRTYEGENAEFLSS